MVPQRQRRPSIPSPRICQSPRLSPSILILASLCPCTSILTILSYMATCISSDIVAAESTCWFTLSLCRLLRAFLPSCHPPCSLPGVPTCLDGAAIDSVMLLAYQQLTSMISAPPIHPKQPCLHPVGAADPSQLSRTITSAPPSRLLPCHNSKTHSPSSAMAFSAAFGLRAHSFPPLQPSGFIPLLLLLVHNLTIDLDSSSPIPCI